MDILAARKKAAQRDKASQQQEQAQPAAEVQAPAPEVLLSQPVAPAALKTVTVPSEPAVQTAVITEHDAASADAGMDAIDGAAPAPHQEVEMLTFRMGSESYAVLVEDVREVLKVRDSTMVPNAPAFILGVMSLRGAMIPIIDLGKRLGLDSLVRDERSRIVVMNTDEEDVGLIVDRVTGVIRVMPGEIKPAPEHMEQGAEFLRGIVRKDDKLFILLDIEKAVAIRP
jgi:purine-binding chemotaxis protein CheW